jgi:hypothetical protein
MANPNRTRMTLEGDIVVTPVADHFGIGRVTADDNTQTYLESHRDRITALGRASILAGEQRRVFLAYSDGRSSTLIDCTDIARSAQIATR